jgi:hypothetical protein
MPTSEMTCRFIPAKSVREWDDALPFEEPETSFSAAYHVMAERIWGGEAWLAVVERSGNRLVWPYISHPIPGAEGFWDINSPYGYGGPLITLSGSEGDAGFASAALDHLMLRWRETGAVTAFTRFCPFHENHKPLEAWLNINRSILGSIEQMGHVVAMDTAQTPEQRWLGVRGDARRDIRKAENFGLRGEYDPAWNRLDEFVAIYQSIAGRNHFAARHLLRRQDFLTIHDCLGGNATMLHIMHEDHVVASAICVISGRVMHGLFAGPHPDYLPLGAYKLLAKYKADWCANRGLHYLNLGGGRGSSDADSLYEFKRGFSRIKKRFYTGRLIVNADKYAELTGWSIGRDSEREREQLSGFFPAYRDPAISTAEREAAEEKVLVGV